MTVKSGGATLDTAGYSVFLNTAFNRAADDPATVDVDESNAAFTVTGGGAARFGAVGNIATLAVGEDTTLRWFDADATVADYVLDSLTLAAGSTLALDVDTVGCDTFSAATTNISATTEKNTTFKLIVRSMPESGRAFPLFEIAEADVANYNIVAETPAGASLVVEKGWSNGFLTYAILAKDYVWGDGSNGGGWTDGAKWSVDGVASAWDNNNRAIFATAGDVATLDADVTAVALDFRANATVGVADGATVAITAPEVSVASGVTATLAAPVAGAFEKNGTGTLVLGTNRTEHTTVAEGTLTLVCTNAIEWSNLTLGTDAAKPVTLRFADGATLAAMPSPWYVGNVANVTSTVVKAGGDWTIQNLYLADAAGADTSFVQESGTLTLTSTVDIGKTGSAAHALFDIAGGTVEHSGYVHLGANCPATMTVRTGARYETTTAQSYGIIVSGNSDATLNVSGGDMFVDGPINFAYYGANGPNAVANVTAGGVLACNGVKINSSSSGGTGTLTLDGGTLRANADNAAFVQDKNNLTFKVGSNGGTIDANGKTITILRPILEAAGSTGGGMAFKGGGIVTLAAGNTYTGTTTIEVGTTVHIPASGAISGGLAVTVPETPPADGVYTLLAITGDGSFPASVLTGVAAPENATLRLSVDAKSVLCIVGNPGFVWIGGASGNLSEASNWANNAVPQSGDSCIIGSVAAASLTLGDTFAPASITFPSDCGPVTISGERTLSGITSIVNNAAQHHVLAFPIDASAATPTLPLAEANYLVFSGGIALTDMPSVEDMRLAGVWNLTGSWNEPPSGTDIKSGASVTVSGTLKNGYNIVIRENATLQVATANANLGADGKNRFLYQNDGTFIVTGEMKDTMLSANGAYSLAGFFANGNNAAVTRANGLVHSASTKNNHQFRLNNSANSATNTIVLGSGGLSFRNNTGTASTCYPYFQIDSGKAATLASSADWSFGANTVSGKDLCLELTGSVTVDTSDYDDRTVPHTVKVIGRIGAGGTMTVTGCGRLEFEHYSDFYNLYVQDTATVACNAGCSLTRTAINLSAGTTFELAQSGTAVALGGNMTLAAGASLAFNFTDKRTAPLLNANGKTVTAAGTVKVKVSSSDDIKPKGGRYTLTSGGAFAGKTVELVADAPKWVKGVSVVDGDIVLDVKFGGIVVIIR